MFLSKLVLFFVFAIAVGCSSSSSPSSSVGSSSAEDSSSSGVVASAFGGALQSSSPNGTVASRAPLFTPIRRSLRWWPLVAAKAFARRGHCPSLASGTGCSSSGNVATITYGDCEFENEGPGWSGKMKVDFTGSTTLTCGVFPTPSNDVMERQYVDNSGNASQVTRTAPSGTVVTVDDSAAGVQGNYESDTLNGSGRSGVTVGQFASGGYGKRVRFVSGERTSLELAEHISAVSQDGSALWDHTVAGAMNISETTSGLKTTWTVNTGTVSGGQCSAGIAVYHNRVRVLGNTCFAGVTYDTTCCSPVSGAVTTTYRKTTSSTGVAANAINGRTETLTYTGCGSAVLTDATGETAAVATRTCF